jgi:predicted NAD-dependent protein-ADP-ribosyltransferase YbiA (DUF1768 family)
MKTKLTIVLVLLLALAGGLLAQTYTNGMRSPRLPVSDQQVEQLRLIRWSTGETNTPMNDFSTNWLTVEIKQEGRVLLNGLKYELSQKVAICDDETTLRKIKALIDALQPAVTNEP